MVKKKHSKAQASLEYVLILALLFAFLWTIFPLVKTFYYSSAYSLDCISASDFLKKTSTLIERVNVLGNGTVLEIDAIPAGKWFLFSEKNSDKSTLIEQNVLVLRVESDFEDFDAKEKTFSEQIPEGVEINLVEITSRKSIRVEKKDEKIIVSII